MLWLPKMDRRGRGRLRFTFASRLVINSFDFRPNIAVTLQGDEQFQRLMTDFQHASEYRSLDRINRIALRGGGPNVGLELFEQPIQLIDNLFRLLLRFRFGDSHGQRLPCRPRNSHT